MRRKGHWFGCLLGAVLLLAGCQGTEKALTAVDQLYCRFVEAPRTRVTYMSLLPEEEQKILCEHTASAAASWYADSNEFSENLDVLKTAYSSGREQAVVSLLRSEYENAAT